MMDINRFFFNQSEARDAIVQAEILLNGITKLLNNYSLLVLSILNVLSYTVNRSFLQARVFSLADLSS